MSHLSSAFQDPETRVPRQRDGPEYRQSIIGIPEFPTDPTRAGWVGNAVDNSLVYGVWTSGVRVIGGVGRVMPSERTFWSFLSVGEPSTGSRLVLSGGLGWSAGLLEECWVDGGRTGEDGFGLGVSVCLPGDHAEGVLFEPVVVEPLSGVVVVDDPVGGFC